MDLVFVIAITLQITGIYSNKDSSSDESIDNILYYKDCNHEKEKPVVLRAAEPPPPPRQPECIPRMCCSMSCNNNCGQDQPMTNTREMNIQNPLFMSPPGQEPPPPPGPMFTPRARARRKKKPMKKPIGERRSLGFTREHIKHLISQDEDIKKILKDLVRVTMQKADLIDMINARRNGNKNSVADRDEMSSKENASNVDGEIED